MTLMTNFIKRRRDKRHSTSHPLTKHSRHVKLTEIASHALAPTPFPLASRAIPQNTSPIAAAAAPLATLHGPGLANGALMSAFSPGESFDMLRRLRRLSPVDVDEEDADDVEFSGCR